MEGGGGDEGGGLVGVEGRGTYEWLISFSCQSGDNPGKALVMARTRLLLSPEQPCHRHFNGRRTEDD